MSCLSSQPGDHRTITSRPKLTLQTTSLPRAYGTSSTGLSLPFAAGAGASPTVRNTFKNAYDVTSPSSATSSPSKAASSHHRFSNNNSKPNSPYIHHPTNNNSFNHRSPYQLPIGLRSILRNSPLETASRRRSGSISAGASGPSGAGTRRVFFPAKNKVTYRHPLEEEIRTEQYTAQHFDLVREEAIHERADRRSEEPPAEEEDDSDSGSVSLSETSTSSDEASADESGARDSTLSKTERKKRRSLRAERQVRAVALLDGLESESYASSTPQTPRQGRVKRRREWEWTLGPLNVASQSEDSDASSQPTLPDVRDATTEEPQAESGSCR